MVNEAIVEETYSKENMNVANLFNSNNHVEKGTTDTPVAFHNCFASNLELIKI